MDVLQRFSRMGPNSSFILWELAISKYRKYCLWVIFRLLQHFHYLEEEGVGRLQAGARQLTEVSASDKTETWDRDSLVKVVPTMWDIPGTRLG